MLFPHLCIINHLLFRSYFLQLRFSVHLWSIYTHIFLFLSKQATTSHLKYIYIYIYIYVCVCVCVCVCARIYKNTNATYNKLLICIGKATACNN